MVGIILFICSSNGAEWVWNVTTIFTCVFPWLCSDFRFVIFFSLSGFKSCIFIESQKLASIRYTVCSYLKQLIYRSHSQWQLFVNNDYLIQSHRSKCNIINPWDNQELDDDSIYQFWYVINVREYRRTIKNGQSRETGNIGYTRHRTNER